MESTTRIYEYTSAANIKLSEIPVMVHSNKLYQYGPTRVIPFDLKEYLGYDYQATSPNLLASFIKILSNEEINTDAKATSQAFSIIKGKGKSLVKEFGQEEKYTLSVEWSEGDLFVTPCTREQIEHKAFEDSAIYWITDEPLLKYLGVIPSEQKFLTTHFKKQTMLDEVEIISNQPDSQHRNRMGILLGNEATENTTKTLTHVLWSLLNVLPAGQVQRPHKHNSVALDLCVSAKSEGVYTLMGKELDDDGWVKDPIRCEWSSGSVFTTPPGWWHSHHNETDEAAWVLPIQDAGLYTNQRTLDIKFSN